MHYPTDMLKALMCVAPDKDVRYYLNGVHFYRNASGKLTGVACSGMHLLWCVAGECEEFAPFTVPHATVKLALQGYGRLAGLDVQSDTLQGVPFKPCEGIFPDARRIFPIETSGEASHFDPELLDDFRKAGKALGAKQYDLHQNGADTAIVSFPSNTNAVGLIAPLRNLGKNYVRPSNSTLRGLIA